MSRPLSASVCGKYDMPSRRPYERIAEGLISACRKHVVAATGSSPFKVGDNQRPERIMSGVRKTSPESSVPGDNLTRGSRRNQLRRGHGSPPVLSEVFSSLALRCALQRVQTVPAAIHSGRIPPSQLTSHGDGRLSQPPHHTGHGPFRTRPPTSVKSLFTSSGSYAKLGTEL